MGVWAKFRALMVLGVVLPCAAQAQSYKTLEPQDAVVAYEAAQVSRNAIRDQLDLCADDADKLDEIYSKLRPEAPADRSQWTDWGELFRHTGDELLNCLRAYNKQVALHRRDVAVLRQRLPLMKEPKRLTLSPKQVAAINAYAAGIDQELAEFAARAAALASVADQSSTRAAALLRDAGIADLPMPSGFRTAL